ncbi:MBL fold metallo-hydrolase [Blastopirellula sp. JC732]|uniref:MBL fold metallo-hydrolase n=1 Tax=Blastopirellula sediminis TaxID=2894196 RepID=A0A9X1MIC8_9BACT|nr:MBL fold metallo-hydrolase [Blastopirellula sediminis]MCC9604302.1 MBL fold metallo-hydrolase [Blastopirellula sediminis]MCC9626822.1 MBL fold metallo-hydrolase [Blastopirellula sediminis]
MTNAMNPTEEGTILQVRAPAINFYVLRDREELYLIDAGFIGGLRLLQRALARRSWNRFPIRGVIVTHGHLDHILNVKTIARRYGAWIAAPRLDAEQYAGKSNYPGKARVAQWLETFGRPILGFQRFTPDRLLDDGDMLDVWQGLKAVHLPGHTGGHMGYYAPERRLLFSGDLFVSYRGAARLPPDIFNSEPQQIPASVHAALAYDLEGVLPNHCDPSPPAEHLRRFRALGSRLAARNSSD